MPRTKADYKKNKNHNANYYPALAIKLVERRKAKGLDRLMYRILLASNVLRWRPMRKEESFRR